jgi:predicted transport protein/RecB family endonuclease NucS
LSDLKLFRITNGAAKELMGKSVALEVSLQRLIEANMETLFGVRFLATEYSTGAKHRGRIDSLGLDETGSPVIFEYKRAVNESVINQGLFYLDWLVDHKGEFQLLVMEKLDPAAAADIDWRNPRVICVASGFTRYDENAVMQMSRSIELVRYQDFEGELLALELVTAAKTDLMSEGAEVLSGSSKRSAATSKTVTQYLEGSPQTLKHLFADLEAFIEALGDEVTKKTLKFYFAYRRLKNFACVEVHPQTQTLLVYLKVDPDSLQLAEGFSRDVRSIGHFGTGELELRIKNAADFAKAQPLIQQSYSAG